MAIYVEWRIHKLPFPALSPWNIYKRCPNQETSSATHCAATADLESNIIGAAQQSFDLAGGSFTGAGAPRKSSFSGQAESSGISHSGKLPHHSLRFCEITFSLLAQHRAKPQFHLEGQSRSLPTGHTIGMRTSRYSLKMSTG